MLDSAGVYSAAFYRGDYEDVATHGSIVEVRLRPVEQTPLSIPMRALQARDLPFQHG